MRNILSLLAFLVIVFISCTKSDPQVVLKTIAIKPDTLTISAGNNLQLVPIFTPSLFSVIPVVWSSADTNVATVTADGTLYAVKTGMVWITIKDKNSATSGKCYVVVQ